MRSVRKKTKKKNKISLSSKLQAEYLACSVFWFVTSVLSLTIY